MIDRFVDPTGEPPRTVALTVIAQDPSVRVDGKILRAPVRVPYEDTSAGPIGHRIHVVDYDLTTGDILTPATLDEDRVAALDDRDIVSDPAFRAQDVYAIASRTLATFEAALGRRLPWSFGGHQLYLVPRAFEDENAYYAEVDHAIYFGYFTGSDGATVYTALSHDVVAHESTHAVLDGLRNRFEEPALPDQAAFHEAFADIVALLSVFSLPKVVQELLGKADTRGRISAASVGEDALRASALFQLAEQMGEPGRGRGVGLRHSADLKPGTGWMRDESFEEPHRRGEVLVAAILHALLRIWTERLKPLTDREKLDRDRAAEEGATAAAHLLQMCIRAIDFCPPLEFEFTDFLDALLAADLEVSPDDPLRYRDAVEGAFRDFGIERPETGRIQVPLSYGGLNYASLRSDSDEIFRFIWQNREALRIPCELYWTNVENVRLSVRAGPDGLLVSESLCDYVQSIEGKPAEIAAALGGPLPRGLSPDKDVRIWGGGVLVFDQFGRAKFHQKKPLLDPGRQARRLAYLLRTNQHDREGRFGFSLGQRRGERFAELHRLAVGGAEAW